MQNYKMGIDIGSTTVKVVVINHKNNILFQQYKRHFSEIKNTVANLLQEAREKWFNSPDSRSGQCARNSIMANAFGHPFYSWQVWDNVRKLTCQHGGFAAVQPPKAAT